jgi:choloylglycine hydrolase
MNRISKSAIVIGLSIIFLGIGNSRACTYFFLKAQDGSIVSGRTDEFYSETGSKIDLVPRGISFRSTGPENTKPLSWKTQYGFVGVSMFDKDVFGEGMNERGLAAGGLYFEDVKYPAIEPGDNVINMGDFIGWLLGSFQSVEEVKKALSKVKLWADSDNPFQKAMPMHVYVSDATGDSIVVECIDGNTKIWDNRANGVMTNEPDLGWHLNNLRFYSTMNPSTPFSPELGGEDWALGSGIMSLPGDYSNASRFVRTSLLKRFSKQPQNAEAGVNLALHLINAIDIPYGPQVWIQGQKGHIQWTVWSVIYDHTNKYFYYRTYENPTLRRFDLNKVDFKERALRKRVELFGGSGYIDDTARLLAPVK